MMSDYSQEERRAYARKCTPNFEELQQEIKNAIGRAQQCTYEDYGETRQQFIDLKKRVWDRTFPLFGKQRKELSKLADNGFEILNTIRRDAKVAESQERYNQYNNLLQQYEMRIKECSWRDYTSLKEEIEGCKAELYESDLLRNFKGKGSVES